MTARDKKIIKLSESGKTILDIAKRLHISPTTVTRTRYKFGYKSNKKIGPRWSEQTREKVRNLILHAYPIEAIANFLGVSRYSVRREKDSMTPQHLLEQIQKTRSLRYAKKR